MSAPDETKREGLKGKPIVDKTIAEKKLPPKAPMPAPERDKPKKIE